MMGLLTCDKLGLLARKDGAVRVSRFHKGMPLACLLLVAGIATSGSAHAQSDDAIKALKEQTGNGATTGSARAHSDDELKALNQRISELYSAGKYAEAIPLAEKSLELTRSQKGQDHVDTATRMGWLALLYKSQGRYGDAEPLYKRAIAISEKVLGADHPGAYPCGPLIALDLRGQDRWLQRHDLLASSCRRMRASSSSVAILSAMGKTWHGQRPL
jgi:tetratricopeptide (TPR) repeat protein